MFGKSRWECEFGNLHLGICVSGFVFVKLCFGDCDFDFVLGNLCLGIYVLGILDLGTSILSW